MTLSSVLLLVDHGWNNTQQAQIDTQGAPVVRCVVALRGKHGKPGRGTENGIFRHGCLKVGIA